MWGVRVGKMLVDLGKVTGLGGLEWVQVDGSGMTREAGSYFGFLATRCCVGATGVLVVGKLASPSCRASDVACDSGSRCESSEATVTLNPFAPSGFGDPTIFG